MRVSVNMSRETYNYWSKYDLAAVADVLLSIYDITSLPPCSGGREIERRIDVQNEQYLDMYETFGTHSKKLSLGRLFEFGANADIAHTDEFKSLYKKDVDISSSYKGRLLLSALSKLSEVCRLGTTDSVVTLTNTLQYIIQEGLYDNE